MRAQVLSQFFACIRVGCFERASTVPYSVLVRAQRTVRLRTADMRFASFVGDDDEDCRY